MVIYLRMGKTYIAKTPLGDFKINTPENPLLSQQAVTSKGIPVPYTNLQLNPCPNTQLNLFCSDNLSFQCTAPNTWLAIQCTDLSTWLTTNLKRMLVAKITKLLGYKTLWCTSTAASWIERWTRAYVSDSQYACEKLLHWVASVVTALKTILIYVSGCEKRKPKHLFTNWCEIKSEKMIFINLDRYPICRVAVEHQA